MLPLSSTWAPETGLPTEVEVSELWDATVLVVSEAHSNIVRSFSPQHEPKEPVSALGCGTCTYHVTDGPEKPEYGSRLRVGLTGRDFGDPRACLRRYTVD